jgi:hypothetical protein
MTPPAVQVDIRHGPADQAQLAAWNWLWRRLLTTDAEMPQPEPPPAETGGGDDA